MSGLTTHVLDLATGLPAAGVAVTLLRGDEVLATTVTNADGRTDRPLRRPARARRLRAALRGRRPLRRRATRRRSSTSCRCASGSATRTRTSMCRCSSRPAATAPTVAADEVVARCRELARVSDEHGRLTRAFGGAGDGARQRARRPLDGGGRDSRRASTPRATWSATCPARRRTRGRCCSARTSTPCATPARSTGRSACSARSTASRACGRRRSRCRSRSTCSRFSDEEGVRFGSAYLGSRAVAGTLDDALLDRADDDGVTRARGARRDGRVGVAGRASGCSATARSTSSRDRCSRSAGCRSASSPRSPARPAPRSRFTRARRPRRDGPDGAAARRGGRAGRAGARGRGGRPVAPTGSWRRSAGWRCGPARRTSSPATRSATIDVRHADDAVRADAVAAIRGARRGDRGGARRRRSTWHDLLETAAVAMDAGAERAARRRGARGGRRAAAAARAAPATTRVALAGRTPVAMLFVRCAGGVCHHPGRVGRRRRRRRRARRPRPASCAGWRERRPRPPRLRAGRHRDRRRADRGGRPDLPGGREEIDARGLVALPGVVDAHVHLNDPGRADWEGFATGTAALAAGGTTTCIDMPLNAIPPTVDGAGFDAKVARGDRRGARRRRAVGRARARRPRPARRARRARRRRLQGVHVRERRAGVPRRRRPHAARGHGAAPRALGLPVAVHAESDALTSRARRAAPSPPAR